MTGTPGVVGALPGAADRAAWAVAGRAGAGRRAGGFEQQVIALVDSRLPAATVGRLKELVAVVDERGAAPGGGADFLAELNEITAECHVVQGTTKMLFVVAGAAVEQPDDTVREVLFSVVGEQTLQDLAAETKAAERTFANRVRVQLRSSYSRHYRQMLPEAAGCPVVPQQQQRLPAVLNT